MIILNNNMQEIPNSSESAQNNKIKNFEKRNIEKSKELFRQLCEMNNGQNTIDLNFIRQILTLNGNQFSSSFLKIITRYQLTDAIKEGNFNPESYYKRVLSSEEFTHFITGKDIKDLVFENDKLNEKRFKTEEYYKLYELMGGNKEGIHKENVKKCLKIAYEALNGDSSSDSQIIDKEVEEIIELLSTGNNDTLSLQDFVNIMTSNTSFPKDGDSLFP